MKFVKMNLCAEVPELMWRDLHTHPSDDRPLNCNSQRPQSSSFSSVGDEQEIRSSPDQLGGDLVTEHPQAVGQYDGQFVLKRLLILGFCLIQRCTVRVDASVRSAICSIVENFGGTLG